MNMSTAPRLTVGLPVYNGASYVAESLDALLGQTFEDFELIISDNASTDDTSDICRQYEKQDSRVSYYRQPRNIGLAPNHNFVVEKARGKLFKWAAGDDLYGRDLLRLCVEAMDADPDVVLAHSYTAMIDSTGAVTAALVYPLATSSRSAPERLRSLLFDSGGDDDGGMMRTEVLRRTAMKESYHHADRTIIAELALHGPFYQVPDWLYFRRDHEERAERACPTVRSRCANMDPSRASRLRNPLPRLYAEYIWGYAKAIRRAPLSPADRRECNRVLRQWLVSRVQPSRLGQVGTIAPPPASVAEATAAISVDALVPGRAGGSS
jgi:glycosyltransferase involved in cell wall biosynthesis